MEVLFQRHGHRFEDAVVDIDASAARLEEAIIRIEALQPGGDVATPPEQVDRISLMGALNNLDSVNLGTVIAGLGASRYVTVSASSQHQAS